MYKILVMMVINRVIRLLIYVQILVLTVVLLAVYLFDMFEML